ncbi:MAG: hypothetical protein EPN88_04255 [Bacteroidetes bacterium]|nr:MAG: hypothetical protein EPN88_04255 [Bacteroidota bacterium]
MNGIEILLVKDDTNNAELTVRAVKSRILTNNLYIAKEEAEAYGLGAQLGVETSLFRKVYDSNKQIKILPACCPISKLIMV